MRSKEFNHILRVDESKYNLALYRKGKIAFILRKKVIFPRNISSSIEVKT